MDSILDSTFNEMGASRNEYFIASWNFGKLCSWNFTSTKFATAAIQNNSNLLASQPAGDINLPWARHKKVYARPQSTNSIEIAKIDVIDRDKKNERFLSLLIDIDRVNVGVAQLKQTLSSCQRASTNWRCTRAFPLNEKACNDATSFASIKLSACELSLRLFSLSSISFHY